MVKYLDLLKAKTYDIRCEIENLKVKLKENELEITKEYFEIGKKAIYINNDGYIQGTIVSVNGLLVTMDINYIDGNIDKSLYPGHITLNAKDLNIKK